MRLFSLLTFFYPKRIVNLRLIMFIKHDILILKQNLYFKLIALLIIFSSCEKRKSIDLNTVFRYNEHKNINSLDPIFAKDIANIQAVNQLFNGLVEMDKELNVVPSVAKSWKISENGKLYTFIINTSVEFHPHPSLEKRNVTRYVFSTGNYIDSLVLILSILDNLSLKVLELDLAS